MKKEHETLVTGKQIARHFDDDGCATAEEHFYGDFDIALLRYVRACGTIEEFYMIKGHFASRGRYEKARADYPDMPRADATLPDTGGERAIIAREKRHLRRQAVTDHQPDPDEAAKQDAFCCGVMEEGKRENAVPWISSPKNTLGELSHAASRRLVAKLDQLGCKQIHACRIDSYDDDQANTGHLVVELPDKADCRSRIFREIGRLAAKQGFAGPVDNGQHYAYLLLD